MRYRCEACQLEFEAGEARCPTCMRQSTVVPADQPRPKRRGSSLTAAGLLTTIAIIVPLMLLNWNRWHHGWWFTFVIALVGFGAGHLVSFLASRPRG